LGAKPKVKKKPSIFAAAMNSIKGFFGGKSKADQDMAFDDENGLSQSEANKYAGGFAEGGKIPKGKVGIVGEKGPEVIQGPADITPTKKWLKENYKTTDEFWTATTGQPWGGKGFQELEMAYLGQEHRRKLADPKYKSPGRGDEWERIARYLDTPEGRKFQYDKGLGSQAQYRALDEAYRQRDLQNIAAGDLQGPKVDPSKTTMSQALYDESRGAVNFGDNGKIKEANAIALDPSMKGDQLAAKSSENDMAKLNAGKSNAAPTNVVNAPTTVNKSTQTNVIKTPVRNQDSSYADYQRSKYAT
jgi:hypothetical protein